VSSWNWAWWPLCTSLFCVCGKNAKSHHMVALCIQLMFCATYRRIDYGYTARQSTEQTFSLRQIGMAPTTAYDFLGYKTSRRKNKNQFREDTSCNRTVGHAAGTLYGSPTKYYIKLHADLHRAPYVCIHQLSWRSANFIGPTICQIIICSGFRLTWAKWAKWSGPNTK